MPTHDLSTRVAYVGATSPQTFSHTCTGSDLFLIVWIACAHSLGTISSAPTYNGVAMTIVDKRDVTTPPFLWCYKLIAPASGAHNVVINGMGGPPNNWEFVASSYTGVHQTTPHGTNSKSATNDAAPTTTVTSAVGELVIDGMGWQTLSGSNNATVDASQAQLFNNTMADGLGFAGSTEAGAASVVMSWTLQTARNWVTIGVPLKPSAPAAAFRNPALPLFLNSD